MPKRQSDPQETRPLKRTRKASTQSTMNALDLSRSDLESHENKMLMTISPALLSGDGTSAKAGGIRRRMNPESLAVRLGPDLVKELESLLVAGMTEMPSFTVRQEIQQRYGIDRRHIYDWFHNKGLRVASSEQREERRAARARAAEGLNSDKRSLRNSRDTGNLGGVGQECDPELTEGTSTPFSSPTLPAPLLPGGNAPYEASYQDAAAALSPSDDYIDEPCFASPCVFGLPPPALLGDSRNPCNTALLGLLSPRYLSVETPPQVPAERTSLWIAEQQRIVHGELAYGPLHLFGMEGVLQDSLNTPLDSQPVLPQPLREAFYQSLVDVLPPARGIEESVGTYKAFMTQQVQMYYNKLASSGQNSGSGPLAVSTCVVPQATALGPESSVSPPGAAAKIEHQSPLLPAASEVPMSLTGAPNEFSTWLLYGGRSHAANVVPSPSCTPVLSETATTAASSGYWLPDPFQSHLRERSTASCMHLNELLESPVLRSRHPTLDAPADGRPQVNKNDASRPEGVQTIKSEMKSSFLENAYPTTIAGLADPPAAVDFVREYAHGNPSKPPAVHRMDNPARSNPTIFIAESGSENFSGALPNRAGSAMSKGSKGKGRPRGRPPAQKIARNK